MSDANKAEIEYQLQLQDRKRDAKAQMRATARVVNGDIRMGSFDDVVGASKQFQSKKKQ
jgi:hypothetical protein